MKAPVRLRGVSWKAVQRVVLAAVGALFGAGPRHGPLRRAKMRHKLLASMQDTACKSPLKNMDPTLARCDDSNAKRPILVFGAAKAWPYITLTHS